MKKRRRCPLVLFVLFTLILSLVIIRAVLPSQIDDVSPGIECEQELLEEVDVYYVIPKFENVSINKSWCEEILKYGKEVRLHGVYHTYKEFNFYRDEEYFNEGYEIFASCFGFEPESFKPPQLAWTNENNWIKERIKVDWILNQLFHKVYHCSDTGLIPNWITKII